MTPADAALSTAHLLFPFLFIPRSWAACAAGDRKTKSALASGDPELGEERHAAEGCGIRNSTDAGRFHRVSVASSFPMAVTEGSGVRASGCSGERLRTPVSCPGPCPGCCDTGRQLRARRHGDTFPRWHCRAGAAPCGCRCAREPTALPKMDFRAGTIHHPLLLYLFGAGLEVLLLLTTRSALGRDGGDERAGPGGGAHPSLTRIHPRIHPSPAQPTAGQG